MVTALGLADCELLCVDDGTCDDEEDCELLCVDGGACDDEDCELLCVDDGACDEEEDCERLRVDDGACVDEERFEEVLEEDDETAPQVPKPGWQPGPQ